MKLLLLICLALWQEIGGREESSSPDEKVRRPVYRAKVAPNWIRIEGENLNDTTQPIVSFLIEKKLRLTVHNFPSDALENRIPPSAQVERWKQQGAHEAEIQPVCHGGFVGLFFEASEVLAWSMQLDLEHYQTLSFLATTLEEEEHSRQMRADYTIKVSGPQELIEKHRNDIYLFANSFELIQPIPMRR